VARAAPAPAPAPAVAALRPPRAFKTPAPAYPLSARRRRAEGLVLVRARIGQSGLVLEASVSQPSGADDLDRAALETVRAWRFQPGMRGSQAVEAWVSVPVRFQLNAANP